MHIIPDDNQKQGKRALQYTVVLLCGATAPHHSLTSAGAWGACCSSANVGCRIASGKKILWHEMMRRV